MAKGRPTYGEIRKYSPTTYRLDLPKRVQEYLKSIGHSKSNVGHDVEVWVRYGDRGIRKKPWIVAIGPTEESVK